MSTFTLIVKSATRNRRRMAFTTTSVAVSFVLITLLCSAWYSFYTKEAGAPDAFRIVTLNRISIFFPVLSNFGDRIRAMPGVVNSVPFNWFGGIYKEGGPKNSFGQFGTDAADVFKVYNEWSVAPDQLLAFQKDAAGAAVPRKLAQRLGWKLGDHIFLQGTIRPITLELTIRAIFDTPTNWGDLVFHWDPVVASHPQYAGVVQGYFISRVRSIEDVPRLSKAIDEAFRNSPMPTKTEPESEFALSFLSMLGDIKSFILIMLGASGFAISMVAANTIAMSVRERISEMAVMRAVGYSRRRLFLIIIGEAVFVVGLGCMIGIVGGWLLLVLAPLIPSAAILRNLNIGLLPSAVMVGGAIFIGAISAFIPALYASRISIASALRHTG
jgi:putative ABC transport system permease protein